MKILARQSLYAKNYYRIALEPHERDWTKDQIRIACDNGGDPNGYDCPFGGQVDPVKGLEHVYDVFVYTD